MKANITNLFYLKRAKPNKDGLVPIFQRITINGKRIDRSSKKYISAELWSVEGAKMKGKSNESRLINSHLDDLLQEVTDAEKDLTVNRKAVNYANMLLALTGKEERERTIIPIFQEHNDKILALVAANEYAIGTWKNYRNTLKHLKKFLKLKYKADDISIHEIDFALIMDFDFYLRTKEKKSSTNSVIKNISQFQKIFNICLDNEWISKDPFKKYKLKIEPVDRGYLNAHEIATLQFKKNLAKNLN